MELFGIDDSKDLIIIAEIGVNHEGSFDKAKFLIESLADTGVNAVKLQGYTPSKFISIADKNRFQRVTEFALGPDEHLELSEVARSSGLGFCSTAVTEDWVEKLTPIVDVIKIASGDIDFRPVLELAAATKRPLIVSTGCSSVEEVDQAVEILGNIRGEKNLKESVSLMHCVSEYPAELSICNLRSIQFLNRRYGLSVGWSNHVIGGLACYSAVSLGATIVEVHVTDSKVDRTFRDHHLSFEVDELRDLAKDLRSIKLGLGYDCKQPTVAETEAKRSIRKGLVVCGHLKKGSILTQENIGYARPATHYFSWQKSELIGRRINKDMEKGESISPDFLEEK